MQAILATSPSDFFFRAHSFLSPMPPPPPLPAHLPVTQLTQPRPRQSSLPLCVFTLDYFFVTGDAVDSF